MGEVRERTLDVLGQLDLEDDGRPPALRRLRLRADPRPRAPAQRDDAAAPADGRALRAGRNGSRPGVRAGGGRSRDGPREGRRGRDRRGPGGVCLRQRAAARTCVELEPFEIDRTPVTNAAFARFIEETGAEPPLYWERDGDGGWVRTAMGERPSSVDPAQPVVHVDHARRDRVRRVGRQAPADRARVGGGRGGRRSEPGEPRPPRLRDGAGRRLRRRRVECGAVQMLGDVWEWTSSDFQATPASRRSPMTSTQRSSSAPITRCSAAGRGRHAATSSARVSVTGTCPSAGRSSPGSAA